MKRKSTAEDDPTEKARAKNVKTLDEKEHLLHRPDTIIGPVEPTSREVRVCDEDWMVSIETREFSQGFMNTFNEVLTNAADNVGRTASLKGNLKTKTIHVSAGPDRYSVMNDGQCPPIAKCEREHGQAWAIQLMFTEFRCGTNFNDKEVRTVAGRNGLGATAVVVLSRRAMVVACNGKHIYRQVFENNLETIHEPTIESAGSTAPFFKVTVWPDLERFGMTQISPSDMEAMRCQLLDVAFSSDVQECSFNGEDMPLSEKGREAKERWFLSRQRAFANCPPEEWGLFHVKSQMADGTPIAWTMGVGASRGAQGSHLSYVNTKETRRGGTHLRKLSNAVVKAMSDKFKKNASITRAAILSNVHLVVVATVDKPAFTTQSKDELASDEARWGCAIELPPALTRWLGKSPLVQLLQDVATQKVERLMKKTDGAKTRSVNVSGYEGASQAGTKRSKDCSIILTEGNSAMAAGAAGMSVVGRDTYGCYPLRGKLMNADAGAKKLSEDATVTAIKTILGLKEDSKSVSQLRYGRLIIMCDADLDGYHIIGLIVNYLYKRHPDIASTPGFINIFVTPLIKATRGKQSKQFFQQSEYDAWRELVGDEEAARWEKKYYKGLATNTPAEMKEYFRDLKRHIIPLRPCASATEALDVAFSKASEASDRRKDWLLAWDENAPRVPMAPGSTLNVEQFVNQHLIEYSMSDNVRSMPDFHGLKPTQKKVIHTVLSRDITKDIKVCQLQGYVSNDTNYHHGDASMNDTIINMACDFEGSNNLPLLVPSGVFGSLLKGKEDAGSPRYIFTRMQPYLRILCNPVDVALTERAVVEGKAVECKFYAMCIPILLVNGCHGIGTGWSCSWPKHLARDVIAFVEALIDGRAPPSLVPAFAKLPGYCVRTGDKSYRHDGAFEWTGFDSIRVTALPYGVWSKKYSDKLRATSTVSNVVSKCTDSTVDIEFQDTRLKRGTTSAEQVREMHKLSETISVKHLWCIDGGRMRRFESIAEYATAWFERRKPMYHARKAKMLEDLARKATVAENKARYIREKIGGRVDIRGKKLSAIVELLEGQGFARNDARAECDGYGYLMDIKQRGESSEDAESFERAARAAREQYEQCLAKDPLDMWRDDLAQLKNAIP